MSCADLDHLVFLGRGDAALTRRASRHSTLRAVVVRFSRSRKRYERQGMLVEEQALARAERECLSDAEARRLARERAAEHRQELDMEYVRAFAHRVGELFPGCPPDEQRVVAEHACQKYSGRVGRTAAAKELDPKAVDLGQQFVKLAAQEMPITPLMAYNVFTTMDTTYFSGYPSVDDPYTDPVPNWGNTKYMYVKIKPKKA